MAEELQRSTDQVYQDLVKNKRILTQDLLTFGLINTPINLNGKMIGHVSYWFDLRVAVTLIGRKYSRLIGVELHGSPSKDEAVEIFKHHYRQHLVAASGKKDRPLIDREPEEFEQENTRLTPAQNIVTKMRPVCAFCKHWRNTDGFGYCVRHNGFSCDIGSCEHYYTTCDGFRWYA